MLTSRIREAGWPEEIEDFVDPIERISAPYYGVEAEELWRRASAKEHIADARVPVLVLHPEDDQVIPVEHARMLDEAASGNELVRVWILPGGGHGALDAVDSDVVLRRRRAVSSSAGPGTGRGDRRRAADRRQVDRPAAKLIYSAARLTEWRTTSSEDSSGRGSWPRPGPWRACSRTAPPRRSGCGVFKEDPPE